MLHHGLKGIQNHTKLTYQKDADLFCLAEHSGLRCVVFFPKKLLLASKGLSSLPLIAYLAHLRQPPRLFLGMRGLTRRDMYWPHALLRNLEDSNVCCA